MKHLPFEDISLLSKVFTPEYTGLLILAATPPAHMDAEQKIFGDLAELESFANQNPYGQYALLNLSGKSVENIYLFDNILTIINFGEAYSANDHFQVDYINNPDGTIRWLCPAQANKPHFLALYNGNGLRAKLIKKAFKLCWKVGLKKTMISSQFSVFTKEEIPLQDYLTHSNSSNWALFTGTVGENRKLVLAGNDGHKTTHFTKIPITEKATELIQNEFLNLEITANYDLQKSVIPKATKKGAALQVSNIQPQNALSSTSLQDQHLKALFEWYNRSAKTCSTGSIKQFEQIRTKLDELKNIRSLSNGLKPTIISKMTLDLETFCEKLTAIPHFSVGLAHGDFTPWNLFLSKEKIHIYDWELADTKFPLMYDMFHFVFQSGVLLEKINFKDIEQRLEKLKSNEIVNAMCIRFSIDFDLHKQFYLLYTISYYLDIYTRQKHLHTQANWLIQCWQQALEKELKSEHNYSKEVNSQNSKIKNFIPKMG